MSFVAPYYPIIFIRGYAMFDGDIEKAVEAPYMGFNEGSTKKRDIDNEGRVRKFIFESPLVRLIRDWGYTDCYRDNFMVGDGPTIDPKKLIEISPKSVWIFRYYDLPSKAFGDGDRRTIVEYAAHLRAFILKVRDEICRGDPDMLAKFKAHLVCHSQGGLIARSYLQRICTKGLTGIKKTPLDQATLELTDNGGDPLVEKLFTYGTPHNGIDVGGVNVPDLGPLSRLEVRAFNRNNIRKSCAIGRDANGDKLPANSWSGPLPLKNVFCLIGSDWQNYNIAPSRMATGESSDGLVMMKNAYVKGAARAVVHRAHGGPFGIVNSEAGFQNLTRFLFGDIRVDAHLRVDDITLPKAIQEHQDAGREISANYFVDTKVAVRRSVLSLHERTKRDVSAIVMRHEDLPHNGKPVYLASQYLHSDKKFRSDENIAFSVSVNIEAPLYVVSRGIFRDEHFEHQSVLSETIRVFWKPGNTKRIHYGLDRFSSGDSKSGVDLVKRDDGAYVAEIPIGVRDQKLPSGAIAATLVLTARVISHEP